MAHATAAPVRWHAAQQPTWAAHPDHADCCAWLAGAPPLVSVPEIAEARRGAGAGVPGR
jgi:hypothetical protein